MNKLAIIEKKPLKGNLTRLMNEFETTNPHKKTIQNVLKEYIYLPDKKILI